MKEILHNRGIKSRPDAWPAFLALDEPEWIEAVIEVQSEQLAQFKPLLEEQNRQIRKLQSQINSKKE